MKPNAFVVFVVGGVMVVSPVIANLSGSGEYGQHTHLEVNTAVASTSNLTYTVSVETSGDVHTA